MSYFKIKFELGDNIDIPQMMCEADAPERVTISNISSGFWVDGNLLWCAESEDKYWIPPARILWVERVPTNRNPND